MRILFLLGCLCLAYGANAGEPPPLLDEAVVAALAQELSGETAKRNLEVISQSHRMRASQGFRAAAEHIAAQLRSLRARDVEILQFPADGKTMFGTQKSRPAWDAKSRSCGSSQTRDGKAGPRGEGSPTGSRCRCRSRRTARARRSRRTWSTSAPAPRNRTTPARTCAASSCSSSSQPEAVQTLAVDRHRRRRHRQLRAEPENGLVGRKRRPAALGPPRQLRDSSRTFAFMVRPSQARAWQARSPRGETVRLEARCDAGRHVGFVRHRRRRASRHAIPPWRRRKSHSRCHLDHPAPGRQRQRQRLRDDPRSGADLRKADP